MSINLSSPRRSLFEAFLDMFRSRPPVLSRLPPEMPARDVRAVLLDCAVKLEVQAVRLNCTERQALADAVRALADGEPAAADKAARTAQALRMRFIAVKCGALAGAA